MDRHSRKPHLPSVFISLARGMEGLEVEGASGSGSPVLAPAHVGLDGFAVLGNCRAALEDTPPIDSLEDQVQVVSNKVNITGL